MAQAIRDFVRGSRTYWLGVAWLRRHPAWFLLLFVPSLLGFFLMLGSLLLFWEYQVPIMRALLFELGDGWFWVFLYYLCKALLFVAFILLALLLGLLTANIVSAPIFELLSSAVEREQRGWVEEVSVWRSLRQIPQELMKVFVILLPSVLLLLVPGLNILGVFVAASLLAWDFYDYPMSRRGWSLDRRLQLARQDYFAILGMGLWLVIPFVHFILMPMAVVGGTLLALERIDTIERRVHGS